MRPSSTSRRPGPRSPRGGGDARAGGRRLPRRARQRRRRRRAGGLADYHGRRRRRGVRALRPLLEALGRNVVLVGAEPGQGQLAKVLNNLLSASAIAITGEAMALGVHGGLSARTLLEVINSSSGRNTATADKFPRHVLPRDLRRGLPARADAQGRAAVPGRGAAPGGADGARRRGGRLWARAAASAARRRRPHRDRAPARAGRRGGGRR